MSPAEQRELWALEARDAWAKRRSDTVGGFRFGNEHRGRLKVLSLNVYYGQVVNASGGAAVIDVRRYAAIFRTGADVVAVQEAVLTGLPRGSPIGNTAKSYAARDAPGQDHWKRWTERFPESAFRAWWSEMKAIAKAEGYRPVPERGCGEAGSMYRQRFGNAVFVHTGRIREMGLPAPRVTCVPELIGADRLALYAGESEDRNAIVLDFGSLTLVNTHLSEKPTSSSETGHSTQRDMMQALLRRLGFSGGGGTVRQGRTVIVGDFNKSDPATVPAAVAPLFTVAYDAVKDREVYDLLRESGFECLPNDRATAWNARHPDQVCSNFMSAGALRKGVMVLMPWADGRVISDHAALAFSVSVGE